MKYQLLFSLLGLLMPALALAQIINFDGDETGKPPKGFSPALTGKGKIGVWVVMKDDDAPSQPNVLAQTDMEATSYRFPLCVFEGATAADVDLSVKFKPVKGKVDQAAGLVWRYRDQNNYYIVRANALENNVVLYKVEKGNRTDLEPKGAGFLAYGKKAKVPSGQWSMLRVVAKGNLFETYLNGEKLFEVEDNTFTSAGKVGLWTKADSYTLFDDLSITELKSDKQISN